MNDEVDYWRRQVIGLRAIAEHAKRVIERLASMEAFDIPKAAQLKGNVDTELIMRIEYAKKALDIFKH